MRFVNGTEREVTMAPLIFTVIVSLLAGGLIALVTWFLGSAVWWLYGGICAGLEFVVMCVLLADRT